MRKISKCGEKMNTGACFYARGPHLAITMSFPLFRRVKGEPVPSSWNLFHRHLMNTGDGLIFPDGMSMKCLGSKKKSSKGDERVPFFTTFRNKSGILYKCVINEDRIEQVSKHREGIPYEILDFDAVNEVMMAQTLPDYGMSTKRGNKIVYDFCQDAIMNKYTVDQIYDALQDLSESYDDVYEFSDPFVIQSIHAYCEQFYKVKKDSTSNISGSSEMTFTCTDPPMHLYDDEKEPVIPEVVTVELNLYNMVVSRVIIAILSKNGLKKEQLMQHVISTSTPIDMTSLDINMQTISDLIDKGIENKLYKPAIGMYFVTQTGEEFIDSIFNKSSMQDYGIDIRM